MYNFDETRHSEVSQWDLSTNRVLEQLNLLFLRYVNSKNDKNWSLQNFDFAPSRVTGIGTEKSYWEIGRFVVKNRLSEKKLLC